MGASKRDQDAFIDRFADIAMEISKQTGVRPEVVLGQTAFETGWGKSVAGNNMFGIKGQGQMVKTKEDYGYGKFSTVESFRAYNDPVESFRDYGDLTLRGKSLSDIVAPGMTAREQVAALKAAGYATDKDYVKNLSATVHSIQRNPAFQNAAVSYATSTIPTADPFLGDVGLPVNRIDVSSIPDLTPAREAGFSFGDFDIGSATLPADFSMDFSQYDATPDFSSITAGTAFDPLTNISPSAPAAPNFSDVELNTYPDISAGMYSNPMESFAPVDAAPVNLSDIPTGPQPSGSSAGVGEGPWGATPDFSAPSLEARNALDRFEKAMAVRTNPSFDMTNEQIAQNLMNEFAPQQTPQAPIAPAPVSSATPTFAAPSAPIGDFDEFGSNFPSATPQAAPQAVTRAAPSAPPASLPAAPAPNPTRTQQQVAKDYDLPSFDLGLPSMPDLSVRGIGSTLGLMDKVDAGFMDAMANPQIAQGWSPGFLDTRLGKAATGAATGFLTGGPIGAVTNGLWSGLGMGDMISNAFDRYANAYANLTPDDFAAFGLDGNWTDREPTRNTGYGGGRVGDGSYSDHSGWNDNSPQGIL